MSYAGSVGITVFNTLVYMSGITAAIPYAFSALAQIKWRLVDHRELHTPRFVRDVGIAVVGLVFSVLFIVYSRNTGEDTVSKSTCRSSSPAARSWPASRSTSSTGPRCPSPPPVPAWRP